MAVALERIEQHGDPFESVPRGSETVGDPWPKALEGLYD
jgi:hypothetical protein